MPRRRVPLPRSIRLPPAWRRHRATIATLLVAASLLIGERAFRAPVGGSDLTRYQDQRFRVVKVVDGDTVDLDVPDRDRPTTRVRLWGVDTPELRGERGPMHFAAQARGFAEQTLLGRDVHVVLVPQDTRDKYGRLLAFLLLERGGTLFNEMLIEQGFAYADPRFNHPYKERFAASEKRARREGAGLWAQVRLADMPAWRQRYEQRQANPPGP